MAEKQGNLFEGFKVTGDINHNIRLLPNRDSCYTCKHNYGDCPVKKHIWNHVFGKAGINMNMVCDEHEKY